MMYPLSPSRLARAILTACERCACFVLFRTGIVDTYIKLRSRKRITILFYHEVGNVPSLGGAAVPPDIFERQIEFIARRYMGVSIDDLHGHLSGGRTLPDHPVIVTFDGGYRGTIQHALPVLREHGIPCLIYLVTDYIEKQELPLSFKLRYILEHAQERRVTVQSPEGTVEYDLHDRRERERCLRDTRIRLESMPPGPRENEFTILARNLGVHEETIPGGMFLTWDEIREADRDEYIRFGSHSITHPNLSRASREEAAREIAGSKREIERNMSGAVTSFCYPKGYFTEETKELVREAGYESATTTRYGLNGCNSDPFELKRIAARTMPLDNFAVEVSGIYRSGSLMSVFEQARDRIKRFLKGSRVAT
jgi:peptidoglycan/xylan/chitin deacetylase (PgdA/CDA1 family)